VIKFANDLQQVSGFSPGTSVSSSCNNVAPSPPSVVSGYGKRSINLNKVVATFEKHIFLSQTDLQDWDHQ
jgi:hypothetical protein